MSEKKEEYRIKSYTSDQEKEARKKFEQSFQDCPIPTDDILNNISLFTKRQTLARILHFNHLYKQILNTHGVIMEFGVRWGPNLALMQSFRGIYEPYNYTRKIIGFDTFSGFPGTHKKDGDSDIIDKGAYSVTENYDEYLEEILNYHESESPISHIKKFEIVKGDATIEVPRYLSDHPETIIAMALFDFDIYEPTKQCLLAIQKHLIKGSIVAFDELNHPDFPGETVAFREVLGTDYKLIRSPLNPYCSYIVI